MINNFILDYICEVECLADLLASKLKQFCRSHTYTTRILGISIVEYYVIQQITFNSIVSDWSIMSPVKSEFILEYGNIGKDLPF